MRAILKSIIGKTIGSIAFLIFLLLANLAAALISNSLLNAIVGFLNSQILLLITIAIIVVLADAFRLLTFPFNLPSPMISGVAAVLSIVFMLAFLKVLIEQILESPNMLAPINEYDVFIYGVAFLLTAGFGYLDLLKDQKKKKD